MSTKRSETKIQKPVRAFSNFDENLNEQQKHIWPFLWVYFRLKCKLSSWAADASPPEEVVMSGGLSRLWSLSALMKSPISPRAPLWIFPSSPCESAVWKQIKQAGAAGGKASERQLKVTLTSSRHQAPLPSWPVSYRNPTTLSSNVTLDQPLRFSAAIYFDDLRWGMLLLVVKGVFSCPLMRLRFHARWAPVNFWGPEAHVRCGCQQAWQSCSCPSGSRLVL